MARAAGSAAGPCSTLVGANGAPQVAPNGKTLPKWKYAVGVRFGPPRTPTPRLARAIQSFVYFCQRAGEGSTWLRSRKPLGDLRAGAAVRPQEAGRLVDRHRDLGVVDLLGSVPLMKCSLIVLRVNGPGSIPLWASIFTSTMPAGFLKSAIGVPLVDLVQERLPQRRRALEGHGPVRRDAVVAVAHPGADDEGRRLGVLRRGDVAHRREVDLVVRRAGLERGRPALAAVGDLAQRPERVLGGIGVRREDVGHDEGGLRADDLLARTGCSPATGQTTFPFASLTDRMNVRGISTPSLAIAP